MNSYITGNTIKRLREKAGMTQAELAEKLGVSDKAVSKWETGKGYPDISLLEPLAQILGVSVTELLSGNEIHNNNLSANMKRSKLYVCPVCGNVIHATGEALVSCCGITLPALEGECADELHGITQERVEDETFVTVNHEMTKEHYISFIAYVTDNAFQFVKLYPEGNAEARFKFKGRGKLFAYCNKHGLYMYDTEVKNRWGNTKEYREFEKRKEAPEKMKAYGDELMKLFTELGTMKDMDAGSEAVQKKADDIRSYITNHFYTCSKEVFAGLGEMYVSDPRFKENIDKAGGAGTAEFAAEAIKIYCK